MIMLQEKRRILRKRKKLLKKEIFLCYIINIEVYVNEFRGESSNSYRRG